MPRSIYQHEAQDARAFEVGASQDADRENAQLAERIHRNSHMLETGTDSDGLPIRIRYCVLGGSVAQPTPEQEDTRPRVIMFMGLAASLDAWKPQILDMLTPLPGSAEAPMMMCLLDNRGVGKSSCPARKADFSTVAMAEDAAVILDHIGWRSVHVVGFSMGGMIATKFAATWPSRTDSLTVVSTSRGNWDMLPRSWRALKYAFMMTRDKTPRMHANLDLKLHFSRRTLTRKAAGGGAVKDGLLVEYMANQSSSGDDPPEQAQRTTSAPDPTSTMLPQERPRDTEAGPRGQISAVWRHKLSTTEKEVLRHAPFPRLCIHGRQDIVAALSRGEKVAEQIAATLVVLEGAHFIPRERGHEVSLLLEGVILGQPRQAERQHLDPMRHMKPDLSSTAPPSEAAACAPVSKDRVSSGSGKGEQPAGGGLQLQRLAQAST